MESVRTSSAEANCKRSQIRWRWTREEDDLLLELVRRLGPGNWDNIAYHMKGRSGKSCRLRWINQLNPKVNNTSFSEEERQKILELHKKYGNKWSTIASHLRGRTDNQVKNQYHLLVSNKCKRASCASFATDPRGPLSIDYSLSGSMSTIPVAGSTFSNDSCQGNICGFAPCYNAISGQIEMMCFSGVDVLNTSSNQGITGAGSIKSDANSAAVRPEEGIGTKGDQFIDFMGVGSSE